jgi:hypothetical protein
MSTVVGNAAEEIYIMETKYLLDTNILYYLTGIENTTKYPKEKIEKSLEKIGFNNIYISEISFLELFTHYDDNVKITECFNYLAKNKIGVFPYLPINTILKHEYSAINNIDEFKKIKDKIFNIKTDIETDLLNFCVESIIGIIVMTLEKDKPLNSTSKISKYTAQCISLLIGNRIFIKDELKTIITSFYKDKDYDFKQNLENIILTMAYIIGINYSLASYDLTILDKEENKLIDDDYKFSKKIISKMDSGDISIFKNKIADILENCLNSYIDEMKISIPIGTSLYFANLIKKVLLDKRRINKNDLLDSQFLLYKDLLQFITVDEKFLNVIKNVDSNYYNNILNITNEFVV